MRNVVVTGASRGLGLGIARRDSDGLAEAREAIARDRRGALVFRAFDLAEINGLAGLVKELRAEFGPFYSLVNNAALGTPGILANMPDAVIDRLMRMNTVSPLTLTKYLVRSMTTGSGGRIVNVSSVVSSTG